MKKAEQVAAAHDWKQHDPEAIKIWDKWFNSPLTDNGWLADNWLAAYGQKIRNETLEYAAKQCDDEAAQLLTCLNPCGPIEAARYIAERIRSGKSKN